MAFSTRRRPNRRNRRARDYSLVQTQDIPFLDSLLANATKLDVTFSQPMIYRDVLPGIRVNGALPTAITNITDNACTLDYAANVVSGQEVTVPPNDPGFRSKTGGYFRAMNYILE